jgi:hypothetical protein
MSRNGRLRRLLLGGVSLVSLDRAWAALNWRDGQAPAATVEAPAGRGHGLPQPQQMTALAVPRRGDGMTTVHNNTSAHKKNARALNPGTKEPCNEVDI